MSYEAFQGIHVSSEAEADLFPGPFLDTLQDVQDNLYAAGVDYRILGSVGTAAVLQNTVYDGAMPLNFNRPGAYTPDQKVPDIDLLLSREDTPFGRELREYYLEGKHPVKVGVATGLNSYDFRPGEQTSRLVHKDIAYFFENSVFEPEYAKFGEVIVRTLSADALLHTFVTSGGLLRPKDIAAAKGLAGLSVSKGAEHDEKFGVFHEFIRERRARYPGVRRTAVVCQAVKSHVPPIAYNAAYTQALKVASKLGLR